MVLQHQPLEKTAVDITVCVTTHTAVDVTCVCYHSKWTLLCAVDVTVCNSARYCVWTLLCVLSAVDVTCVCYHSKWTLLCAVHVPVSNSARYCVWTLLCVLSAVDVTVCVPFIRRSLSPIVRFQAHSL